MGGGGSHKVTPHSNGDASGLESLAAVRRHLLLCHPDPPAGDLVQGKSKGPGAQHPREHRGFQRPEQIENLGHLKRR